ERVAREAWDRRADVFSLAVLGYELLAGKRVSGIGAEAAALPAIEGADMPALGDAFARAMAPNPGDRFATALDFVSSIRAALAAAVKREPLLPLEEARPVAATELQRGLAEARSAEVDDIDLRAAEAA